MYGIRVWQAWVIPNHLCYGFLNVLPTGILDQGESQNGFDFSHPPSLQSAPPGDVWHAGGDLSHSPKRCIVPNMRRVHGCRLTLGRAIPIAPVASRRGPEYRVDLPPPGRARGLRIWLRVSQSRDRAL